MCLSFKAHSVFEKLSSQNGNQEPNFVDFATFLQAQISHFF